MVRRPVMTVQILTFQVLTVQILAVQLLTGHRYAIGCKLKELERSVTVFKLKFWLTW
jgi:hypothetical protein